MFSLSWLTTHEIKCLFCTIVCILFFSIYAHYRYDNNISLLLGHLSSLLRLCLDREGVCTIRLLIASQYNIMTIDIDIGGLMIRKRPLDETSDELCTSYHRCYIIMIFRTRTRDVDLKSQLHRTLITRTRTISSAFPA